MKRRPCAFGVTTCVLISLLFYFACSTSRCQDQYSGQRAEDDASLARTLQINADLERQEQTEALKRQVAEEDARVRAEQERMNQRLAVELEKQRRELERLKAEQKVLREQEVERQKQEQEAEKKAAQLEWQRQFEFARAVSASQYEAIRLFPDAGVPTSDLYKRISDITDKMKVEQNPILQYPDWPVRIAKIAAEELGTSPRDEGTQIHVAPTP